MIDHVVATRSAARSNTARQQHSSSRTTVGRLGEMLYLWSLLICILGALGNNRVHPRVSIARCLSNLEIVIENAKLKFESAICQPESASTENVDFLKPGTVRMVAYGIQGRERRAEVVDRRPLGHPRMLRIESHPACPSQQLGLQTPRVINCHV